MPNPTWRVFKGGKPPTPDAHTVQQNWIQNTEKSYHPNVLKDHIPLRTLSNSVPALQIHIKPTVYSISRVQNINLLEVLGILTESPSKSYK